MNIREIREKCKTGMHVRYMPPSASGDRHHPDCRDGIVSTVCEEQVFVRFGGKHVSEPCDPEDLEVL